VIEQYSSFDSVCIAKSSTGIFRCNFFLFEFSSVKSFRNQIAIEYFAQVCTAPMLSKSEKMLMNLNSKQKSLCHLASAVLFPRDIGKQQKNDKRAFGSDAFD